MENKETTTHSSKKGTVLAAAVLILILACGLIYWLSTASSRSGDEAKNENTTKTNTSKEETKKESTKKENAKNTASPSGEAVSTSNPDDTKDMPVPTLSAQVADTTILDSDPEPKITMKQNQQQFLDYMNAGDYANAKNILDSYFAVDAYPIESANTFENFTYYYEIQKQYTESVLYQLDFLESNMGLENIIETNPRYQHFLQTLPYASVTDKRIDQMAASAARWKEIEDLLAANKVDTSIAKLKEYLETGAMSVYAYYNLGQAYKAKGDSFAEAKTYYIFLLKMKEKENLNQLERDYEFVLTSKLQALYAAEKITEQQKDFLVAEITSDMKPY